MSINGNYNVLLGAGARLPSEAGSHQIVLGSSADTVYLGGAGTSSAGGVIINSAGVTLSGVATFTVSGKTGALGQALTSAGAGAAPYWGPPLPRALASDGTPLTLTAPLASIYTVTGAIPWALTLPPPALATGTGTWLKSMTAGFSGTVGGNVVSLGEVAPATNVTMVGGDGGYFESDGVAWWVLSANQRFPPNTYVPTITALTVTGSADDEGPITGGTSITITGAYFSGATSVVLVPSAGGTDAPTSFVVTSDSTIVATTPPVSVSVRTKYFVRVTTPSGANTSTGNIAFYYDPVPTVTAVSPAETGAGQTLTITGTNFIVGETRTVTFAFDGGTPVTVTNGTASSSTSMTVAVPALPGITQGTIVTVQVTTQGGISAIVAGSRFVYDLAPALTGILPSPAGTGTNLTLTGANFNTGGTVTVTFAYVGGGPVTAQGSVINNDISVVVPALPGAGAQSVGVSVTTLGGASGQLSFSYILPPTLTSLSAIEGPLSGPAIDLIGTNFVDGLTTVMFGNTTIPEGSVTFHTTSKITVTPPTAIATAAVPVTVTTPAGTTTPSLTYTYYALPTLASLSPPAGPQTGGNEITLTGTNFVDGLTTVKFNTTNGTIILISATSITVRTPFIGTGGVPVTVVTPGGTTTPLTYTYYAPPTLASLSTTTGPLSGGSVILTGTNFVDGLTTVKFGALTGAITAIGATSITVTPPTVTAAGSVDVTVVAPGGTTAPLTYTYYAPPTLASLSATAGPLSGGSVILTGTNYVDGLTTVKFGALDGSITAISATSITVTPPTVAAAGPVDVTVVAPGGTTAPLTYTYYALPTLASLSPPAGPQTGGNEITLTGTNFVDGLTTVKFNTTNGTIILISATSITVRTPFIGTGGVPVTVVTPGGTTTPLTYTYYAPPTLASLSPTAGPLSGGSVVLTGTNFVDGSTTVRFGAVEGTITYFNPALTSMTVSTPTVGSAGPVSVTVETPGGTSAGVTYTFSSIILTGLTPSSCGEGDTLTADGSNLTIGAAARWTFTYGGGSATQDTTIASPVTVVVPALPSASNDSLVSVTVTIAGITSNALTTRFYNANPTVTSWGAPAAAGATINLTGTNFIIGFTRVVFGTTPVTATVTNTESLSVVVPAGTGAVALSVATVGSLAVSSPSPFYYTPTIAAATLGAPAGGTVAITGTNFVSGATAVYFGTGPSRIPSPLVTFTDSAHIAAAVPSGTANSNPAALTVETGTGAVSNAANFYYAPAVTTWPLTAAVGSAVTFVGSYGNSVTAISFGGVAATIGPVSSTNFQATVPTGTGQVTMVLEYYGGGSVSSPSPFYYAPTFTAVSPNTGSTTGSTKITITGTNFASTATVTVGGAAAATTYVNATTLTAVTPAGSAGACDVVVTVVAGVTATGVGQFTYAANAPPTVLAISPNGGPITGGTAVTITGACFLNGSLDAVSIGGFAVQSFSRVDDSTITAVTGVATAPNATASVNVTTSSGTNAANTLFNYVSYLPTILGISPSTGSTVGGTEVTITGINFTGATAVTIGAAVAFVVESDTVITAVTPATASSSVYPQISKPAGDSTNTTIQYTYGDVAPTVLDASATITAPGATIGLVGSNFTGATLVRFVTNDSPAVITEVAPTVTNDSNLSVVVPGGSAGGRTATVTVFNGAWSATSASVMYQTGTQQFEYTGTNQTFTVPAGATQVEASVAGSSSYVYYGSSGATINGSFSVNPGDVYTIVCGDLSPYAGGSYYIGYSFEGLTAGGGGYSAIFAAGAAVDLNGIPTENIISSCIILAAGGGGGASGGGASVKYGANAGLWSKYADTNTSVGEPSFNSSINGAVTNRDGTGRAGIASGGNGAASGTQFHGAPAFNGHNTGGGGSGFYGGGQSSINYIGTGGGGSSFVNSTVKYLSSNLTTAPDPLRNGYITLKYA